MLYLILVKVLKLKLHILCAIAILSFSISLILGGNLKICDIFHGVFIVTGFKLNFLMWHEILHSSFISNYENILTLELHYILNFSPILMFLFSAIDLINENPIHENLRALQKGKLLAGRHELSNAEIDVAFKKITRENFDGTLLGVSMYTGKPVVIPDKHINSVLLILGTTGSGKTITIRNFYNRAVNKKNPIIYVDGKPDDDNIKWLIKRAEVNNVPFYGFNCGNFCHYNPLASGGYTELKDKIICLKDEWASEYYRSIAEDYLQTTCEVLLKANITLTLPTLIEYFDFNKLITLAREIKEQKLMIRVQNISNYDLKDLTGLNAHLNILVHSELGQYFSCDDPHHPHFSLQKIIDENAVVYFALPALSYPSFAKVLGKLIINDIKSVINRLNNTKKKVFTIFDEFSIFAGDQVLNLVNMGRGKGVHAIFGTQGLADLEKEVVLKKQILNSINTLICHRINDTDSAEEIANWIGTRDKFTVTAQLGINGSLSGLGSVRQNKKYLIHPDNIKQDLDTGIAFMVSKNYSIIPDKVKMNML